MSPYGRLFVYAEKSSRRKTLIIGVFLLFSCLPTSHTTVRAVPHTAVPILGVIRDTTLLKLHTLPYIGVALVDYPLRSTQCIMASSFRTEAVARFGELVLIDGSQYLVYGLLHQTVYNCRYSQQAHLAVVFGYFYPFHWVRTVRTVHQGTNEFIIVGQ